MQAYVIRCDMPDGRAVSVEIVAATELDAISDFKMRFSGYKLRSIHRKPIKPEVITCIV